MVGLGQSTVYRTLRYVAALGYLQYEQCCSGESERISDGCMDKTNGPFKKENTATSA